MLTKTGDNSWSYLTEDRLVTFHLDGNTLHFEDGPADESARRHESNGGSQDLKEFMRGDSHAWIYDYPGLYDLIRQAIINR